MPNWTDTIYRIIGSEQTIDKVGSLVKESMSLRDALDALGYTQPDVTETDAVNIRLYDDPATSHGGTAHYGESLMNFVREAGITLPAPLSSINDALRKNGIMPVSTDGLALRGSVIMVDTDPDGLYVDIYTADAWCEQEDFIDALHKVFSHDPDFNLFWQCEEPGCEYFATNVEGGFFGEYVVYIEGETEYYRSFTEARNAILEHMRDSIPSNYNAFRDWLLTTGQNIHINKFVL